MHVNCRAEIGMRFGDLILILILLNSGNIDVGVNSLPFAVYLLTLGRGEEKWDNDIYMYAVRLY